jgi:hypothetical protein
MDVYEDDKFENKFTEPPALKTSEKLHVGLEVCEIITCFIIKKSKTKYILQHVCYIYTVAIFLKKSYLKNYYRLTQV